MENIDEVEKISLLTTCTTKLHKHYMVTLHILDFLKKKIPKILPISKQNLNFPGTLAT